MNISTHIYNTCSRLAYTGREIISFDRSKKKFSKSHEGQLKGRSEMIVKNLAVMTVGALLAAFYAYTGVAYPNGGSYFGAGLAGGITLICLKEAVLQSFARSKEKARFHITQESAATQYSLRELLTDPLPCLRKTLRKDEALELKDLAS